MRVSSKKKNISVLIPDGESHLLLYVVNCLSQEKDIDIYVMSSNKHNPMRYSRYINGFSYYVQTHSDLDWIEHINTEVEKHNIDLIMPIFETRIKTLIQLQSKIKEQDKIGLLPSLTDYKTAFNKNQLTKHLEGNKLPFAKSVTVTAFQDLEKIENLDFPVIIKPIEGFGGGQGIFKFDTIRDLKKHFNKAEFKYENIIQEYIEGYDIDCSVLCRNGEILAHTIQKGNMMGANQFSPQFGLDFIYEEELYKVIKKIMKTLNWSGVAHIDMRYDNHTNQFKAIEVNTRFWVSVEASLLAGVNFPYLYCLSSLGQEFNKPEYECVKYLSLKGLIKKIKQEKLFVFNIKFMRNNTALKFIFTDPIPTAYKFIWRNKNILISRFRKLF